MLLYLVTSMLPIHCIAENGDGKYPIFVLFLSLDYAKCFSCLGGITKTYAESTKKTWVPLELLPCS